MLLAFERCGGGRPISPCPAFAADGQDTAVGERNDIAYLVRRLVIVLWQINRPLLPIITDDSTMLRITPVDIAGDGHQSVILLDEVRVPALQTSGAVVISSAKSLVGPSAVHRQPLDESKPSLGNDSSRQFPFTILPRAGVAEAW